MYRTDRDRIVDEAEEAMLPLRQQPCTACGGTGHFEDDLDTCDKCCGIGRMGAAFSQFRKLDPFYRDKPTPYMPQDKFVNDAERVRFKTWMERGFKRTRP